MFSLGQRLQENPSIDFSGYSARAGMYSKLIPMKGKEKNAITDLITKTLRVPFKINEYHSDPHLTVIWSRLSLDKGTILAMCDFICRRYLAAATSVQYWEGHNKVGYVVLNVKSDAINELHELLIKLGAIHSFNTYEPHITLASGVGSINSEIRNWMEVINERLRRKQMPLSFTSLSFCDLFD